MILGVDTDVLVSWAMAGAPRHLAARRLLTDEVHGHSGVLGLTPQVVQEFLHITTDPRRFESPLPMPEAIRIVRELWEAEEVVAVPVDVLRRTLELMERFQLGRKRILDTALAATLEAAGVRRLATFNPGDYRVFPFLEVVEAPEGTS